MQPSSHVHVPPSSGTHCSMCHVKFTKFLRQRRFCASPQCGRAFCDRCSIVVEQRKGLALCRYHAREVMSGRIRGMGTGSLHGGP